MNIIKENVCAHLCYYLEALNVTRHIATPGKKSGIRKILHKKIT